MFGTNSTSHHRAPTIEERDDGTYVVDGGVPIQEVNERLNIEFETDEVETIGGFVFGQLGREPQIADEIEKSGYVLHVDAIDNARIERLVIQPSGTVSEETQ